MYRSRHVAPPRKGVILLVVLAMLTLFVIVGLGFVFYADSEAAAARVARDGGAQFRPDVDPELALSEFLGQLIYDTYDDERGVYSALRGHSLLRNMYGYNYTIGTGGGITNGVNNVPFNGLGRVHYADPQGRFADAFRIVNYTYRPSDGYLVDPERYGSRAGLRAPGQADNRGPFFGGFNPDYTYPDLNSYYLGAVNGDGYLLTPSYHREWLFGRLDDTTNPNWTNQEGKYLTARPRPADHAGFPYPVDRGGDVKNLIGYPGGCDSIWIDVGAPVLTAPDGRKYKMLVAPLVLELDGRVNLSIHGNVVGLNGPTPDNDHAHVSNLGLGPWEVNLGKVLTARDPATGKAEWPYLFVGRDNPKIWGRYGPDRQPNNSATAVSVAGAIRTPHPYGQMDYDGYNEITGMPTGLVALPGATNPWTCFPIFPAGYGNGSPRERTNHPLIYNYFTPYAPRVADTTHTHYDLRLKPSNLDRLLRMNDTGGEALTSTLERLCPMNFNDPGNAALSFRTRNLVTDRSGDRNQPGIVPFNFDPTQSPYQVVAANPQLAPKGPSVIFPAFDATHRPGVAVPPGSDFTSEWRSRLAAALKRIDLNRSLPNYPSNAPTARYDVTRVYSTTTTTGPGGTPVTTITTYEQQFRKAHAARQDFAVDIYKALLDVTGVAPAANPAAPTADDLRPRRWLAQLAVNIVDYIDDDEISTPLNFYPDPVYDAAQAKFVIPGNFDSSTLVDPNVTNPEFQRPLYWVFGTELPRLVMNEVLVEYAPPQAPAAGTPYTNKVWVELYNPLETSADTIFPAAYRTPNEYLGMPSVAALGTSQPPTVPQFPNGYAAYRVTVANGVAAAGADNNNVTGAPGTAAVHVNTSDGDFAYNPAVPNSVPKFGGGNHPPYVNPRGYFLVGPPGMDAKGTIDLTPRSTTNTVPTTSPIPIPYVQTMSMEFQSRYINPTTLRTEDQNAKLNGVTVMLRRLANPHIPFNPNPMAGNQPNPWYNPYLTIDHVDHVPLHNTVAEQTWASRGKVQPYASYFIKSTTPGAAPTDFSPDSQVKDQQPPAGVTPPPGATLHTFGQQNNPVPAGGHYDWLTHLDRQLVSPAEILHVSQFQPYQLTQRFMRGNTAATRYHHAPLSTWFDETHRLYRVFELLETRDRFVGNSLNGKTTGKINLNAIWDVETLKALFDAQPGNHFTDADVQTIFNQMLRDRSPQYTAAGARTAFTPAGQLVIGPTNVAGTPDRPFLGFATTVSDANSSVAFPNARGINDTIFRAYSPTGTSGGARLFESRSLTQYTDQGTGDVHPYVKTEMLTKLLNNVTTRSNVFAVWVTVGFFEVTDATARPPKLGAEIGASEGRAVRHRMFAVVDRSAAASNPGPKLRFNPRADATTVPYYAIID